MTVGSLFANLQGERLRRCSSRPIGSLTLVQVAPTLAEQARWENSTIMPVWIYSISDLAQDFSPPVALCVSCPSGEAIARFYSFGVLLARPSSRIRVEKPELRGQRPALLTVS